jgi:SAM-dependent methyltransferase
VSGAPDLRRWPEPERRAPARSQPTWAVRAPLAEWLQREARRAADELGSYSVLDVGCGAKPYYPFFAPYASSYVGVDRQNPAAELEGTAEDVPAEDGTFDLVLCTQVLEHVDDPAAAVRELRRVAAPGGRVLASTHGVQFYHPNPDDYWRWTHAGLARLFRENGDWARLEVAPGSGTAACVGMLLNVYADLALRRLRLAPLARAFCSVVNTAAAAVDARSPRLREPGHTSLHANYHVVAEVPR